MDGPASDPTSPVRLEVSGSGGFFDRSEMLEEHRRQRDRIIRHLHSSEERDRMRVAETSAAAIAANARPFFEHAGLGVPGQEAGPHSRPWTTDGRPLSGSVEMPAIVENFENPYDPDLAEVVHSGGSFDAALFHEDLGEAAAQGARKARGREVEEEGPEVAAFRQEQARSKAAIQADAKQAMEAIEALVNQVEADADDADQDESRRTVQRDIEQRLDSLARVHVHLDQFMRRNRFADTELSRILAEREVEMRIIDDSITHLGGCREEELTLWRWDQQLKRREDRQREALRRVRRDVADVATMTIPHIPDPFELAQRSPEKTDAEGRTSGEQPASPTSPSLAVPMTQQRRPSKKGDAAFRVARVIGSMAARTKRKTQLRSSSPTDEAKASGVFRPENDDDAEFRAQLMKIPKIEPPRHRVVLVHMQIKYNEVQDALERETSAFMAATFSVMRLVSEVLERFEGYITRLTRTSFTVAFGSDAQAVQFVLYVQTALIDRIEWQRPLLRFRGTANVPDPRLDGRTLFRGLRLAVGIHASTIESKVPWRMRGECDQLSGRVEYMGPEAQVAMQLADLARGGEIFITTSAWESIKEHAPLTVFTAVTTREVELRLTPDEARRSSLGMYVSQMTDEGFCVIPISSIQNLEQHNRRDVLGPHPRQVIPPPVERAGLPDDAAEQQGTSSAADALTQNRQAEASMLSPLVNPETAGGHHATRASFSEDPMRSQGLNVKPLRVATDMSQGTFVVVSVPRLAQLSALPGGGLIVDMLRSCMQRCMDTVVSRTQLFNRSMNALQSAPTVSSFPTGGFSSQTFDETVALFKSESAASRFALMLHDELRYADWPSSTVTFYRKLDGERDEDTHWHGLRVAVGIASSVPVVSQHRSTGLFTYEGAGLSLARELALSARGGQCLVPNRIVEVLELKGVASFEHVVECINPEKSNKDTQVFALYAKQFAQRHDDLGRMPHETLVRLMRSMHEIRAAARGVEQPSSMAAAGSTDAFLVAAEKMCSTQAQFEMALRAVHSGVINDKSADVVLALLANANKQGLVSSSVADAAKRRTSQAMEESGDSYEPHLVAQDGALSLLHRPRKTPPAISATVCNAFDNGAREVSTQCAFAVEEPLPGKTHENKKRRKRATRKTRPKRSVLPNDEPQRSGDDEDEDVKPAGTSDNTQSASSSAHSSDSEESQSSSEVVDRASPTSPRRSDADISTPSAPVSPRHSHGEPAETHTKRRKKKASRQPQTHVYKTQVEILQDKENRWKALHKVIQERKERQRLEESARSVERSTTEALLLRRERKLQALVERKAREAERVEKRKRAWRQRQEEKKNALKSIIHARLEEMMQRAQNQRESEEREQWRLALHVDQAAPTRLGTPPPDAHATSSSEEHPMPVGTNAAPPPRVDSMPPSAPARSVSQVKHASPAPAPPAAASVKSQPPAGPPADVQSTTARPAQAEGSGPVVDAAAASRDAAVAVPEAPPAAAVTDAALVKVLVDVLEDPKNRSTKDIVDAGLRDVQERDRSTVQQPSVKSRSDVSGAAHASQSLDESVLRQLPELLSHLDTVAAADDIAKAAVDELSVSSIASSVLGLLDDSDDDLTDVDSLDAGSDVEELLQAAGIKTSPRAAKPAAAGNGEPPRKSKLSKEELEARRFERRAKRLLVEAKHEDEVPKRKPRKSTGVQCDLGPRMVVRRERAAAPKKAMVTNLTLGEPAGVKLAPAPSSGPEGLSVEASRAYDPEEEVVRSPLSPKMKGGKVRQQAQGARGRRGEGREPSAFADLAIQPPESLQDAPAMQEESYRQHADEDEEELSFATHLVQRRDVIAAFFADVELLLDDARDVESRKALDEVPALAAKAQRGVFAPLRHYLGQLSVQQAGREQVNSRAMLDDINYYAEREDDRRAAGARLRWKIGAERITAERKAQVAMSAASAPTRNAKLAVVVAHLRRLSTFKDLEKREREGRLALLIKTLEDLFRNRIETLPQVPAAVNLTGYEPQDTAQAVERREERPAEDSDLSALAASPSKQTVVAPRMSRRAQGAALRAAGVKPLKADVHEPANYAQLRETLLSYDPQLTVLPNTGNPDFDPSAAPATASSSDEAAQRNVPPDEEAPLPSNDGGLIRTDDAIASPPPPQQAPSPPSKPRDGNRPLAQGAAFVGKTDEATAGHRRDLLQLELQIHRSATDDAARSIDDHGGVRMQLPTQSFDEQQVQQTRWLLEMNSRIADQRRHLFHHRGPARAPSPVEPPPTTIASHDPRTARGPMRQQSGQPQPGAPLPPVRGAKKKGVPDLDGLARTPRPARQWM